MRVLVSAYACEPHKGSEPGTGWNWATQAARFHETWVLTRANNRSAIEAAAGHALAAHIHWVYFDLPDWVRAFKRGRRGHRLYYHLWQLGAWLVAWRLHRAVRFEVIHHATFAAYWLPSFLSLVGPPVIIGPVGGGETAPSTFRRAFGARGYAQELGRALLRRLSLLNPMLRMTLSRAALVLATTPDTQALLRLYGAPDVRALHPPVGVTQQELTLFSECPAKRGDGLQCISIGRLVHWKGFELGLRAFAQLKRQAVNAEYVILGDGPEQRRLERLAKRLGVSDAVRFLGRVPRHEELALLCGADVLLHPSIHDPGAWVCIEAMGSGKPVVCLEGGGPAALIGDDAGFAVPARTPGQVIDDLAVALLRLAQEPSLRAAVGAAGRARVEERFMWDRQGELMNRLYHDVAERVFTPALD